MDEFREHLGAEPSRDASGYPLRSEKDLLVRIGQSLGASLVVSLPNLPSSGPLDLMQLRAEVAQRLKSSGGRPTDPTWNVQRLVPFQEERWRQLEELAEQLSSAGRRVSPGQLAAMLIERVLNEIPGAGRPSEVHDGGHQP